MQKCEGERRGRGGCGAVSGETLWREGARGAYRLRSRKNGCARRCRSWKRAPGRRSTSCMRHGGGGGVRARMRAPSRRRGREAIGSEGKHQTRAGERLMETLTYPCDEALVFVRYFASAFDVRRAFGAGVPARVDHTVAVVLEQNLLRDVSPLSFSRGRRSPCPTARSAGSQCGHTTTNAKAKPQL